MNPEELYARLVKRSNPILDNIRRSHNRGFSQKTIDLYKEQLDEILKDYIICAWLYRDDQTTRRSYEKVCIAYNKGYARLKIDYKLPEEQPSTLFPTVVPTLSALATYTAIKTLKQQGNSNRKQPDTMANFDFGIALKLDELKSTKATDVASFLELTKCYHETLNEAGKTALIKFLQAGKIKGEAKIRYGSTRAETLEQLKDNLYRNVLAAETEEEILTKIQSAKQGKRPLKEFASYLADLTERLTAAMIRQQHHTTEEQRAATQAACGTIALNQFKKYCHDEVKVLLAAAQPKTLDEALAVATSSGLDGPTHTAYFTNQYRQNGNQRYRHNNNRNSGQPNGNRRNDNNSNNSRNGNNSNNNDNWRRNGSNSNHQNSYWSRNNPNTNNNNRNNQWNCNSNSDRNTNNSNNVNENRNNRRQNNNWQQSGRNNNNNHRCMHSLEQHSNERPQNQPDLPNVHRLHLSEN